jgi:hypothetical protein
MQNTLLGGSYGYREAASASRSPQADRSYVRVWEMEPSDSEDFFVPSGRFELPSTSGRYESKAGMEKEKPSIMEGFLSTEEQI